MDPTAADYCQSILEAARRIEDSPDCEEFVRELAKLDGELGMIIDELEESV